MKRVFSLPAMAVILHTALILYISIVGWLSTDPSYVEDQRIVWSTFVFVIDWPLSIVASLTLAVVASLTGTNFADPAWVKYFCPFWFMLWGGLNWYLIGRVLSFLLRESAEGSE